MLEEALGEAIQAKKSVDIEILNRFTPVYVADGSVIILPDELRELWQGSGGTHGKSLCNQTGYLH